MIARRKVSDDVGETLIELLVAIVVLGIAAVGLVAGLSTGIFASDAHRRLTTAESNLRDYGELVKDKVLHPATTKLTTDLPSYANGDNLTLQVDSTSDFTDSGQYTIAVDGVLMLVKNQSATTFSVQAMGGGESRSGATVERYESCPTADYWDDVLTDHPELTASNGDAPSITGVTYYDKNNSALTASECNDYHSDSGKTTCSLSSDWRTACDPPWISVAVRMSSTNAGRSAQSTTTNVIIRRVA